MKSLLKVIIAVIAIMPTTLFSQNYNETVTIEPASTTTEKALEVTVPDSPTDFFRISNSTSGTGQFIPYLIGYHDTDNRLSLMVSGQTSAQNDTGTNPLLSFDARLISNQPITTRPLFEWKSHSQRKMLMKANGNLGINVDDPSSRLHVYNNATMGDWGSITTSNATVRIQDATASMYLDGNTIYSNALMNIGTIGNSHLTFGTNNIKRMTILNSGNVGIGVSTPSEKLEVNGTVLSDNIRTDQNNTKYSQIIRNGNGTALYVNQVHANKPIMRLSSGTAAANEGVKFSVESTGATRIGTHQIPSGYMLAVSGKSIMTEVKVAVTPWPDYVFTPSYDLKSLEQVETFINENGHLPNIPSAKEVEENNGIELGEMNAKLLEKIEELTLYTIDQQKTIDQLLERIEKLENQ
ncbi:MAG: hypothetical protein NXI20_07215 [bacterium]|nr:hypothetical protein [bacterium]